MKIGDLIRIYLLPYNDFLSEGLILKRSSNRLEFLESGTGRMCYWNLDRQDYKIEVISEDW
jgi:hypothetical protein